MMNLTEHIDEVVTKALSAKARQLGIDDSEVGYALGGFGAFGLIPDATGNIGAMAPCWTLIVSLRHKLIGVPPIAVGLPVPGPLPPDEDFRVAVNRCLDGASEAREQAFRQLNTGNVVEFPHGK